MVFICYNKCSTCKKAQAFLDSHGLSYESRPIKEQNPTAQELEQWHKQSGLPLKKFFNTSGQLYQKMGLKDKLGEMDEKAQYDLLARMACWSSGPSCFWTTAGSFWGSKKGNGPPLWKGNRLWAV